LGILDAVRDTRNDFLMDKAQQAMQYRAKGQSIEFWSKIDFVRALTSLGYYRWSSPHAQPNSTKPQRITADSAGRTMLAPPLDSAWQAPKSYPGAYRNTLVCNKKLV
jgi:hypothetical protein